MLPAGALTHCVPTRGPGDTFGTGPEVKSTTPLIVVVFSVAIALATFALSLGAVLFFSAWRPASNADSEAPSCCVHCLPEAFS